MGSLRLPIAISCIAQRSKIHRHFSNHVAFFNILHHAITFDVKRINALVNILIYCILVAVITSRPSYIVLVRSLVRGLLLWIIVILLASSNAEAVDSLIVHRYDETSGLYTTNIRLMLEDSRGYLWCGSEEGLMCFDGYRFQLMGMAQSGPQELHSERIQQLYADKADHVWIVSATKIFVYSHVDRRFLSFPLESKDANGINGREVHGIFESEDGVLWIVTDTGINAYVRRKQQFVHYPYPRPWNVGISERFSFAEIGTQICMNISGNVLLFDRTSARMKFITKSMIDPGLRRNDHFRCVAKDSDHSVIIVNRAGLYRYSFETGRSQRIAQFTRIATGALEENGILWISFDDGRVLRCPVNPASMRRSIQRANAPISLNDEHSFALSERRAQMPSMMVSKDGSLWLFAAGYGLRVFDPEGRLKREVRNRNLEYSSNAQLLEDRTGCIWFAAQAHALYRIERYAPRFGSRHLRFGTAATPALPVNNVRGFLKWGADSVLIASLAGLYIFDRNNLTSHKANFLPDALTELHSYPVWCLAQDALGRVWIGTGGAGLVILDPASGRYLKIDNNATNERRISDRRVRCIEIVDDESVWIGTWGGVDRIDLRSFDLEDSNAVDINTYIPRPGDSKSLSDHLVFDIHRDSAGRLWFATENGLNLYDSRTDGFSRVSLQLNDVGYSASRDVRSIFEDAAGELWFGTHGDGLYRYQVQKRSVRKYGMVDGLPSPIIYGILGDGGMELWMTTHRGLCRLNSNSGAVRTFDMRDGIQHLEFNTGAVLRMQDGHLFVGGPMGFNYFHPEHITDLLPPPKMQITQVLVNGQEYPFSDQVLILDHHQNFLTFAFSSMSNYASEANRYRFKLDGVDDSWVHGGTKNSSSYTQLDPGEYVFRVIGSNAEGSWSNEAAVLHLVISAPWWATGIAKGMYALLTIGLIVGLILSQKRRAISEERIRAAIREAELRELTNEAEQRAMQAVSERQLIEREKSSELKGAYAALEQAHENLLIIQQRLNTVVSGAPIVLFALDRKGIFTFSEGAGLEKIGLKPGQAIGQDVFTMYKDYPEVVSSMRRALSGEEFTTVHVVNGTAFETRTSVLRNEEGELDGMIGVSLDITNQLQAQQQLKKLSSAVEQSPAIVIITDTNGIVEYVNPTFTRVTGYSSEEIIGKTPRLLKSGMQKSDDYRMMWNTLLSGEQWRGELHNRRKDGTMFWVSSSISPLNNEQGKTTHFIGIQEDITERKQTEEKLANRREALETIDRIVQVVNAEVEFPRVIRTLLEQGMRLLPQAEKCVAFQYDFGVRLFRLIDTIGYDSSIVNVFTFTKEEIRERYLQSSNPLEEGIFILHHKQDLPGEHKFDSIPQAASSLIISMKIDQSRDFLDGYLVFDSMHDEAAFGPRDAHKLNRFRQHAIIALRKAEMLMNLKQKNDEILRTQEQLIVQEKLASLGRLTAGIAHEIQNPLNFVINFSEVSIELLEELATLGDNTGRRETALSDLRKMLNKVYMHSRRAEGVVNNMMMHSHLSSDGCCETNINSVLEQTVILARRSSHMQNAACSPEITLDLDMNLQPINIVPHELSRVFLGMIENAIDAVCDRQLALSSLEYTPLIRISTTQTSETTDIHIWDNGSGIPDTILQRIFDPFFTTKSPGKGTGLGLSISYDLIRQKYHGVISVETEIDKFTKFHISIPHT